MCGCNKGARRPTRQTVVPGSTPRFRQRIVNQNANSQSQIQSQSLSANNMPREQRELERKKRIQLIVSRRNSKQ